MLLCGGVESCSTSSVEPCTACGVELCASPARLFSYLSLVMCFYGGAYALWSLPSSMTLFHMGWDALMSGGGKAKKSDKRGTLGAIPAGRPPA